VTTTTTGALDAQAAWTKDRKTLTIGVVNGSTEAVSIPLKLSGAKLKGSGTKWQIAGPDPMAYNDPDQPPKVVIEESKVSGLGESLPVGPCSITLFSLPVE
jgi:alpha-L-arabinofuranosidase